MRSLTQLECTGVMADWPKHMSRAFELARSVLSCAPNPRVGCVIVRDGNRVGEGFHAGAGQQHAEMAALARDPQAGAGATVFLTLEPCSHQGRTGACTRALIDAGVARIVVAALDPNPRVSGIRQLEAAGIEVFRMRDFGDAALELNRGFVRRMEIGRPLVRCKLAMSLDGRTALADGASQWITGAPARADGQLLRAGSCAVVTGVNTVIADDPSLNVRPEALRGTARKRVEQRLAAVAEMRSADGEQPPDTSVSGQPLRVILDSRLRTPPRARLLSPDAAVLVFCLPEAAEAGGLPDNVELIETPASAGKVDPGFVLDCLATRFECNEILIEAGPVLGGALIRAGLVDELVVYMAPRLLGSDAYPLLAPAGIESLESAPPWDIHDVTRIGGDLRITVRPSKR